MVGVVEERVGRGSKRIGERWGGIWKGVKRREKGGE